MNAVNYPTIAHTTRTPRMSIDDLTVGQKLVRIEFARYGDKTGLRTYIIQRIMKSRIIIRPEGNSFNSASYDKAVRVKDGLVTTDLVGSASDRWAKSWNLATEDCTILEELRARNEETEVFNIACLAAKTLASNSAHLKTADALAQAIEALTKQLHNIEKKA